MKMISDTTEPFIMKIGSTYFHAHYRLDRAMKGSHEKGDLKEKSESGTFRLISNIKLKYYHVCPKKGKHL